MDGQHDVRGSQWNRWDPHIHTPGTALEDRFRGDWGGYLAAIESSTPRIRALGVTDYCVLNSYEAVVEHRKAGRLSDVSLIFPNVELRYDVGTPKGSGINVHLLVNPESDDHLERLKRFLGSLTFTINGDPYACNRDDLIRLGKAHNPSATVESAALAEGINQFKVNREMLHQTFKTNQWARENILVAVAVSSKDGTAALQHDDSFTTVRRDIEHFAHIIFSAQENQRLFWLGQGAVTGAEFLERHGGPKPCIHGSDAHSLDRVGKPNSDRYTWIKGDLTFDSLRQVCFEPETRVFIGPEPPRDSLPSQTITTVELTNGSWLKSNPIQLNAGLVAIIGARGSGKTALADIIAAGAYALPGHLNKQSFAVRAQNFLQESTAELHWQDGDCSSSSITADNDSAFFEEPRVQYLSQQFVDQLCSSEGVTDRLLHEITRVVFDAHPSDEQMGTATFDDLLQLKTTRARTSGAQQRAALNEALEQLLVEWQKSDGLKGLKLRRDDLAKGIDKDKRDRSRFIGSGTDERVKHFDSVQRALEDARLRVQQANRRWQSLLGLRDEINNTRTNAIPMRLAQLRQTYSEAALADADWQALTLRFTGQVDEILVARIKEAEGLIKALSGPKLTALPAGQPIPPEAYIPAGVALDTQPLNLLQSEADRLQALIGMDARNAATVKRLSEKISKDESTLAQIDRNIADAEQSPKRMAELNQGREAAYGAIFASIIDQELQLSALYEPLKERLAGEPGALQKLSFSVRRKIDLARWVSRGEELLDLRKSGAFQGRGALLERAKAELLPAWASGSSEQAVEAVAAFRKNYEKDLIAQAPIDRKDADNFKRWWTDISEWLLETDHISVAYSIQYDGVDIEQLSPGTRGIVLLLLYLAIDNEDTRPLIIDQPEENLDPKSIHDELVLHFRRAKQRRQIVVVTHNANLVVNTDAEQVIVADCGPHQPGRLPDITYTTGALENPNIRKRVCDILEGGEAAFRERAKRLQIKADW